ncbi:helix-turn-helix domain-containing protein [Natrialba asiatica]|uniref:Bacterio-opsin activator HTH domain-containing protein n=1 Tax=Natrialba asiatica (strain ATCC 700177 / DSM 12278 / JCM 9576 / FERM P-10747 / NBRC 102637 / 172P1) TaxID=29540 RepID=M0AWK7_NATA1|nr:helix-turn-helix domain-containing protein [Natrialba asiatica]ELZ02712.1 bacterio-opsin activator HTH domain-containing protein [Natrialba asiatica DSM 12278]
MAVIAHLRIPANSFELGWILELEASGTIELENMVPLGEKAVPFFSVSDEVRESFEKNVSNHPSVERIVEVTRHNGDRLYSLDWNVSRDVFFQGILDLKGQLLSATGTPNMWEFEIRFPTHEALSEFQEYCSNAHIPLEVGRIYNPVRPGTGMWYGVTKTQRETLMRAVQGGYYSIPRRMSTQDLADDLGVSDQAVTERLRRAIETLTENTLIAMEEELEEEFKPI